MILHFYNLSSNLFTGVRCTCSPMVTKLLTTDSQVLQSREMSQQIALRGERLCEVKDQKRINPLPQVTSFADVERLPNLVLNLLHTPGSAGRLKILNMVQARKKVKGICSASKWLTYIFPRLLLTKTVTSISLSYHSSAFQGVRLMQQCTLENFFN